MSIKYRYIPETWVAVYSWDIGRQFYPKRIIVDYIGIERFFSLSLAIYLSSYFPQMEQHCRRNKTITKSQNIFYKI
ncbi:MAG TPA: hypothetical protein QKA08_00005, partial [Candidatus Megaira endosymbiont of Nemacystus decipiens]|nr:hypothetical protein [Candidatus Megaera endosymbiont of Nemacystus decipiens]